MKFLYSFFLIFLFFNNTSYLNADNLKIVFIDMDTIFNESLVGKSLNEHLKKIDKDAKQKAKSLENEIKLNDEKINSQKNILNENELKKKISDLNIKIKEYQNFTRYSKKKIKQIQVKNSGIILENLKPILSEYSKKNSISLILQKKDLIIGKNELDITKEIIKTLDTKIKKINFD